MHKKKQLYKMLYIFGKPVLGHLCFKYLKMIISSIYASKNRFSKALFKKIYELKGCAKNADMIGSYIFKKLGLMTIIKVCISFFYC